MQPPSSWKHILAGAPSADAPPGKFGGNLCRSASLLLLLAACQSIGPVSIEEGRLRYNEAIQDTTGDQLLTNIARVYLNETPLSLEVTQIVSGTNATGSLGGSITGLGIGPKSGAFRAGSLTYGTLTPTLSYSEQPSVTYQPLTGQALVQEFTTPVPVNLITSLWGSGWPILTILEMVTSKLTDNDDDYGTALNAITDLDNLGAIDLEATEAQTGTGTSAPTPATGAKAPQTASQQTLSLYFIPPRDCSDKQRALEDWHRLLAVYQGSLPATIAHAAAAAPAVPTGRPSCQGTLDRDTSNALGVISLNTLPRRSAGAANTVGALQDSRKLLDTYSAYGILKQVSGSTTTAAEIIQVITPEMFATLSKEEWNASGQQWYTLLRKDICSENDAVVSRCQSISNDGDSINNIVDDYIRTYHHSSLKAELYTVFGDGRSENNLNQRRRLILIQKSTTAAENPFREIYRNGDYYFIDGKDYISQKNFALLELVISVQAISQTPPPQQSISVGAH